MQARHELSSRSLHLLRLRPQSRLVLPEPSGPGSLRFEFKSNVTSATFECRFDDEDFGTCLQPLIVPSLGEGHHTFAVRAIDDGRADPTPATREFTTDLTPPAVADHRGPDLHDRIERPLRLRAPTTPTRPTAAPSTPRLPRTAHRR